MNLFPWQGKSLRMIWRNYLAITGKFPTCCESIIAGRDPIFFKGIREFLEKGSLTAFVGVGHIPGILTVFVKEGYRVTQDES